MTEERFEECSIERDRTNHSRRCFVTGEYCSQLRNVQHKRDKLKDKSEIQAFVVMNYSNMSEVLYKWRIESFVRTLKKYFYIGKDTNKLFCCYDEKEVRKKVKEDALHYKSIEKINVVRADSTPSSNYVVCNNICQQMQMSDLVVVDVSNQNPNVFYELGMAVAMGKLILPICYSESFFNRIVPESLKKCIEGNKGDPADREYIEKQYIGCYPWRKKLFEYYGLIYKDDNSKTEYASHEIIKNPIYDLVDLKYSKFPYHEGNAGDMIYNKLRKTYNQAKPEKNTLVVYTMERFLNERDAGRCIVNFYRLITEKMRTEECFSGERVGVLGQENRIIENDKDVNKQFLFYDVGDIIQIGLNQATYQTSKSKLKTEDVLDLSKYAKETTEEESKENQKEENQKEENQNNEEKYKLNKEWVENLERCVKDYVRNRGLLVYPQNPVFVNRIANNFYGNLFEDTGSFFCLYYVMLKTLKYVNQLVVDISNNNDTCTEEMFWLGAAHGKDIHVITTTYEDGKTDSNVVTENTEKKERNIFDVSGLWKAVLKSYDTEGFYNQLLLAQKGVEHQSKLIIPDSVQLEDEMEDIYTEKKREAYKKNISEYLENKKKEERGALESFYRNRFWKKMLRYNKLNIYVPQRDDTDQIGEPRVYMVRWDFDAVAELSNYLSKRSTIGQYRIKPIEGRLDDTKQENYKDKKDENFISIGNEAQLLGELITSYISKKHEDIEVNDAKKETDANSEKDQEQKVLFSLNDLKESVCTYNDMTNHSEIAQVLLWREDAENDNEDTNFKVSIIGTSEPATYAASLLFVDEEQKKSCMIRRKEEDVNDLVDLQEKVRKDFYNNFEENLERKLDEDVFDDQWVKKDGEKCADAEVNNCIERYINMVCCAAQAYLSTVLYRYFLPFLSARDRNCINNGMEAFLNHMKASEESPFSFNYQNKKLDSEKHSDYTVPEEKITEVIKLVKEVLKEELSAFRGIEAFYEVTVNHESESTPDKDTREVLNMNIIKKGNDPQIHYLRVSE